MTFVSASPYISLFIESDGLLAKIDEVELGLLDGHILCFKRDVASFQVDLFSMTRYSKAESRWPSGEVFCIFNSVILLAERDPREQLKTLMDFFFQGFYHSIPYDIIDNWQGKTFDKFMLILKNEFNLVLGCNEAGTMGLVANDPAEVKVLHDVQPIADMFPSECLKIQPMASGLVLINRDWHCGRSEATFHGFHRDSEKENAV